MLVPFSLGEKLTEDSIIALIINTLGVATDLSLLVFLASQSTNDTDGLVLLLVASFESAGILVGIGTLYPVYQWSISQRSLEGGAPYYICAVRLSVPSQSTMEIYIR